MKLNLTVTHRGVTMPAKPGPADFIRYERMNNVAVPKAMEEGRVTTLAWLAWSYLHRNGHTTETFELWAEGLDDFEAIDDGAGPLAPAPLPG